jgi:hypothetical protein
MPVIIFLLSSEAVIRSELEAFLMPILDYCANSRTHAVYQRKAEDKGGFLSLERRKTSLPGAQRDKKRHNGRVFFTYPYKFKLQNCRSDKPTAKSPATPASPRGPTRRVLPVHIPPIARCIVRCASGAPVYRKPWGVLGSSGKREMMASMRSSIFRS